MTVHACPGLSYTDETNRWYSFLSYLLTMNCDFENTFQKITFLAHNLLLDKYNEFKKTNTFHQKKIFKRHAVCVCAYVKHLFRDHHMGYAIFGHAARYSCFRTAPNSSTDRYDHTWPNGKVQIARAGAIHDTVIRKRYFGHGRQLCPQNIPYG